MQFEDYDRITDNLFYLSDNLTLNFTVTLSRKDKSGNRSFFHFENEYGSKYHNRNQDHSIKRTMNFYFTIDNKNDFGMGMILRPQDIFILSKILNEKLLPLFFDNKKRIYKIIENRLVIVGEFETVFYPQSEYKYISFTPIICTYEDGTFKEGVRITLNHESEFADIDIDRFMGFMYILTHTDMYAVACNMATYVKTPPYGVNIYKRQGLGGGVDPNPNDTWNTNVKSKTNKNSFLDSK